jgi:hypothetical protein
MAHFSKNKKDMKLFAGSILFITVMVIFSVAVDAMEEKTTQNSQKEQLAISSVTFSNGNTITIVLENNGTATSQITEVWINNEKQTFTVNSTNGAISPNKPTDIRIFYTYSNGTDYHVKMITARGNTYLFTATTL